MARNELKSSAVLRETMGTYYRGLATAARDRSTPIAWCTSVGPAELLRALGYTVYFPENHAAMLGAARKANATMPRAHALGYSPDVCSYLTSDVGAYLAGESALAPFGLDRAPQADVLVFNTNQCRDVRDWFEFYGRTWNVPVIGITSPRSLDDVGAHDVDAVAKQIEALVPALEAVAGTRLDSGRLEAAVREARACSDLWRDCLGLAARRPSPLTFFDATIHMGPAVVLRGDAAAPRYYRVLLHELGERASAAEAATGRERFRLYWEGMPVWGRLRALSELFADLGTAVVASTYCNSWIFDALDPADPVRSMARASLELFIVRSEGPKERYIERMVREFAADGIVMHDCRTCPNNSNTRYGMPRRLTARLGLPVLVLDGDVNDLRCFSDEQARTNIEGFIEMLGDRCAERP